MQPNQSKAKTGPHPSGNAWRYPVSVLFYPREAEKIKEIARQHNKSASDLLREVALNALKIKEDKKPLEKD